MSGLAYCTGAPDCPGHSRAEFCELYEPGPPEEDEEVTGEWEVPELSPEGSIRVEVTPVGSGALTDPAYYPDGPAGDPVAEDNEPPAHDPWCRVFDGSGEPCDCEPAAPAEEPGGERDYDREHYERLVQAALATGGRVHPGYGGCDGFGSGGMCSECERVLTENTQDRAAIRREVLREVEEALRLRDQAALPHNTYFRDGLLAALAEVRLLQGEDTDHD